MVGSGADAGPAVSGHDLQCDCPNCVRVREIHASNREILRSCVPAAIRMDDPGPPILEIPEGFVMRCAPWRPESHVWHFDVLNEVARARGLHPKPDLLTLALAEEAGEVVQAVLNLREGKPGASREAIRKECIQTMAMCVRLMEEGDPVVMPEVPCGD